MSSHTIHCQNLFDYLHFYSKICMCVRLFVCCCLISVRRCVFQARTKPPSVSPCTDNLYLLTDNDVNFFLQFIICFPSCESLFATLDTTHHHLCAAHMHSVVHKLQCVCLDPSCQIPRPTSSNLPVDLPFSSTPPKKECPRRLFFLFGFTSIPSSSKCMIHHDCYQISITEETKDQE